MKVFFAVSSITTGGSLLLMMFALLVFCEANDDETWIQQSIEKIQHHKNNIERALLSVKYALVKNHLPAAHDVPPWTRPGARIGRSYAEKSIPETENAVQKSEAMQMSQEPHIGMTFQVFEFKPSPASEESPLDSNDEENESSKTTYELLEPIQLDLGLMPEHLFDYAYKPVGVGEQQKRTSSSSAHANVDHRSVTVKPDADLAPIMTSMWWQMWFKMLKFSSQQQRNRYERVGKSAFAGGSHGSVWRGRRRCDPERTKKEECDDSTSLILKRLKIEQGLPVLEAGLREVYIGNLLARDEETRNLFTVYVDHFFREVPRPSFLGRGAGKEHELWIVSENAGPSMRNYLYDAVPSGDFVLHQQSALWTSLRLNAANVSTSSDASCVAVPNTATWDSDTERTRQQHGPNQLPNAQIGRPLMREILRQILTSAKYLHERGIVHRDIKPSNVMCQPMTDDITKLDPKDIKCVLGDFSSIWDAFTDDNLYFRGPTVNEQTDEYAPPESLPGPTWVPFYEARPIVYDSWSVGVLALEILLGTPNVFSVDQRTTALLTHKMQMKGASQDEIQRALYLAALSQFCIYMPKNKSWPLRVGDPLFNAAIVKHSCTLKDFHHALRARDPLGIGFDSRDDSLLHLIWKLLAMDPTERITASEALRHPYFTVIDLDDTCNATILESQTALESLALDPRMDIRSDETVTEFTCPKCGRSFNDWPSCHTHVTSRKHAKFCTYDRRTLPTCLNAHAMLPAHPNSGYCDIQGRRRTIEDFHSIHLHPTHQFYGIFDGHTGNLASKYAAATAYKEISERLSGLNDYMEVTQHWRNEVQRNLTDAFSTIHENFLKAVSFSPLGVMDQSGTTATIVYVTDEAVVVASVGDSRAILSSKLDQGDSSIIMSAIQLTPDHVASDPNEKKLVEQRGGVVTSAGLPRVNGTLAITRSLGDDRLSPWLSREPHVAAMSRRDILSQCGYSDTEGLPCFIVLASDGLWDVVSNQEAVDMVSQAVKAHDDHHGIGWESGGAFQEAAEILTQEAYVRGSTDNIGVCIIAID